MAWLAAGVGVLILAAVALLVSSAAASRRADPQLGLEDGRLRPCGRSPNCVSSEPGTDARHAVEPLRAGPTLEATREEIHAALYLVGHDLPSWPHVMRDGDTYVAATCRSRLFGFDDDLELRIDQASGVVHVRSGSRVGTWDFGANRRRVEALRAVTWHGERR